MRIWGQLKVILENNRMCVLRREFIELEIARVHDLEALESQHDTTVIVNNLGFAGQYVEKFCRMNRLGNRSIKVVVANESVQFTDDVHKIIRRRFFYKMYVRQTSLFRELAFFTYFLERYHVAKYTKLTSIISNTIRVLQYRDVTDPCIGECTGLIYNSQMAAMMRAQGQRSD